MGCGECVTHEDRVTSRGLLCPRKSLGFNLRTVGTSKDLTRMKSGTGWGFRKVILSTYGGGTGSWGGDKVAERAR